MSIGILLGNGDGTFQAALNVPTASYTQALVVADLNGDGKSDVAVQYSYSSGIGVILGNGNGTFQSPINYSTGIYSESLAVGDVNGDGHADLILASLYNATVNVLQGNGDGTFEAAVGYATPNDPYFLAVGDFNGDGKTDIAVTIGNTMEVSVLLGGALPDLAISIAHGEGFMQGQIGATYTITVTNIGQVGTSGAAGVVNTLASRLHGNCNFRQWVDLRAGDARLHPFRLACRQ